MYFHYSFMISHRKMASCFICANLSSLYPTILSAKFGWNRHRCSAEKEMSSIYFSFSVIISPWKRAWVFIWTNLNPIYPTMRYAKFGRNWVCGSAENDFEFRQYIFAKKSWLFTWIPFIFTIECVMPSLVEIGLSVLEVIQCRQCIFAFSILSPFR
mgnify:CR=1 FL=1